VIEQEWKLRWFLCIGTRTYYYTAADAFKTQIFNRNH